MKLKNALCGLACLGLMGCGLIDEFEIVKQEEATIPGTFMMGPFPYPGFEGLNLRNDQSFANHDLSPDDVDAIFIKSVQIEGSEPVKDDLGAILESVTLFVEAPNLARKQIAHLSPFPNGPKADLVVDSSLNLKPYATSSQMSISTEVDLIQQPAFQTTLRTTVVLLVDVNLLGS